MIDGARDAGDGGGVPCAREDVIGISDCNDSGVICEGLEGEAVYDDKSEVSSWMVDGMACGYPGKVLLVILKSEPVSQDDGCDEAPPTLFLSIFLLFSLISKW